MSRELAGYLLGRFGQLLLIVFIAVSVNFLIPRLLPGDPVQTAIAKLQASGAQQSVDVQAVMNAYRAKYGLDQPMIVQYLNYWRDLSRFDLGTSIAFYPGSVRDEILRAAPWTIGLLAVSTILAFLIGSVQLPAPERDQHGDQADREQRREQPRLESPISDWDGHDILQVLKA